MGVYMLIIAYQNTIWQGEYFNHDISWRASKLCIFAGVVSTISSEVSVLTLTVVTIDRLICIVFAFRFRRMSFKTAVVSMIFVWLLGLVISIIPLFHNDYFYDFHRDVHFYGRSAVCLPFHFSAENIPGWEYSVAIFLCLNGVSFIFILVAYFFMYRTVTKASNAVRSTRTNHHTTIAIRMIFIILTDFLCWFPVIIISILSLTGHLGRPKRSSICMDSCVCGAYKQRHQSYNLYFLHAIGEGKVFQEKNAPATPSLWSRYLFSYNIIK